MRVDLVIIFVGVIVHVNQPWSFDNTAVLPHVPSHKAELVIPKKDLANPAELDFIPHRVTNKDQVVIDLEGMDVRVKGTRGIFNRRTEDYKKAVPVLAKTGGCRKLHRAVRDREQGRSGALASGSFVDIRGGRMVPHRYAPDRVSFHGTDFQNRCAACSVKYEAELRGDTALLVFRIGETRGESEAAVQKLHLKKGAQITVANIPTQPVDAHFEHSYEVFEQCRARLNPGTSTPCGKPECEEEDFDWGDGVPAVFSPDCIIDDAR